MGQMSWLAYLVDTQNKEELIKFLAGRGFRNPKFAAKQFLEAGKELKDEKKKKCQKNIKK
ncbi:MAG: hypothetical protein CME31_07330 [Gimesia sp.]|jgi:hypothetical protein|nr:hypothetical protein [Gimesia sp.]|tara:strand:+ start:2158 stop:2337 length:180 start_codon:yes stop_codon:yes gene_type:complete